MNEVPEPLGCCGSSSTRPALELAVPAHVPGRRRPSALDRGRCNVYTGADLTRPTSDFTGTDQLRRLGA